MATIPRAWRPFLAVLVMAVAVVGFFEQERRALQDNLQALRSDVDQASKQLIQLRERERKLAETREARTALASHLMDAENGTYYRQLLETMVAASRTAGVKLDRITFTSSPPVGAASAANLTAAASGTEAQLLSFVRHLEEGQPLGQFAKLNWNGQISAKADPGRITGQIQFDVVLYGPLTSEDAERGQAR